MTDKRRLTDPDDLKGLTHPLRRTLYRLLTQLGPATVTMLAEHADADPGQISYHLRELGKRGFIEEAPELARDRRERWWKVVPGSLSWSTSEFADPAGRALADTAHGLMIEDEFQRLRAYLGLRDSWGEEWRNTAQTNNSTLRLAPEELRAMCAEIDDVIVRWSAVGRVDPAIRPEDRPEDGREHVFLFLHAFPERP